ncbi:hypothetical protein C8J56DRAFT_1126353 [Mycena floridula]|nr:hypothetical protein C8J56DRAFT_1126353 [Mycena floridula]
MYDVDVVNLKRRLAPDSTFPCPDLPEAAQNSSSRQAATDQLIGAAAGWDRHGDGKCEWDSGYRARMRIRESSCTERAQRQKGNFGAMAYRSLVLLVTKNGFGETIDVERSVVASLHGHRQIHVDGWEQTVRGGLERYEADQPNTEVSEISVVGERPALSLIAAIADGLADFRVEGRLFTSRIVSWDEGEYQTLQVRRLWL